MMLLFIMNFFLSMIFLCLTHPLSLGLMLLMQTFIISMMTGNFNHNFWFSYIIFLILIGGMLILFIYMTSIASNEKFKFNFNYIMMLPLFLYLFTYLDNFMLKINMINNEMMNYNNYNTFILSLIKYSNFPLMMLLMFIMMYLFLTLIAVVKITNLKYGPLRQMN